MKNLVLVFHPNISNSRVNKVLAEKLENEAEETTVKYMYDLYPDFKIDVAKEQVDLEKADRIVLQFPMYWYSSPALVKQWEDDVLTHGWAYGSQGKQLAGKELLIAVTPGAKEFNYVHNENFNYTVTDLLRPFQATSQLIHTKFVHPFIVTGASYIEQEQIEETAVDYLEYLKQDTLPLLGTYE